ncbi:MAG: hypothetical protein QM802_19840 [Agriterribacter sp.]
MKYFIAILSILVLLSCRASRENRKFEKEASDSAHVTTVDSTVTSKSDSLNVTENNITEETTVEATLEFSIEDSTGKVKDTVIIVNGNVSQGWLNVALNKPNLKSLHYKEKKKKQDNTKSTTQTSNIDSSAKKTGDSTQVGKVKEKGKDTIDVKQWSFWGLLPWYVWLIIGVLAVGFLWWKFPFLFKRKKQST